MSRLSIEISPEQHKKIKALAALQGQSIKDYILNKLFRSTFSDEEIAMQELERILLSRINNAKSSSISSKTFNQITEDVLRKTNT